MQANFLLGTLKLSELAKEHLRRIPFDLIAMHAINEHGRVTDREMKKNMRSMKTLGEITSRFRVDPTDPSKGNILVITSKAWGETIIKHETE